MDFEKFDKSVDLEGLQKDVEDAAANGFSGEYKDVPAGKYEVKIEKMEIRESKKGDPMAFVQFRILQGSFENSCLFWNQVITQGFQISLVNKFLESLGTAHTIEFKSYSQYNDLILDIMEAVDGKIEYLLDYTIKKGFGNFKIEEIYDV